MPDDLAIDRALADLSCEDRAIALAFNIIQDTPGAVQAIAGLIGMATIMSKRLTPAQRLVVKWYMLEKLEELSAQWH